MSKNLQFPADLVTFTEEFLNGKLHLFWCVTPLFDFMANVGSDHFFNGPGLR